MEPQVIPIFTIAHSNLYAVSGESRQTILIDKPLQILYFPAQNLCSLSIDFFRYSLYKEIPILRHGKLLLYALPDLDSYFGVELGSETKPEEIKTFEKVLKENIDIVIR